MIDFEAALKALAEGGVNFVVSGGYAATLLIAKFSIEPDGANRLTTVPAPVQRRQQLCST